MEAVQRYTWEDALIGAEVQGIIGSGEVNTALRLAMAINWSPKDGRPPGLYWANDEACKAVGVDRSTFYRRVPGLATAGFFRIKHGNWIPTLPESQNATAEGRNIHQSQDATTPEWETEKTDQSQVASSESQVASSESQVASPESQHAYTFSVDTFSEDISSVDSLSVSEPAARQPEDINHRSKVFGQSQSATAGQGDSSGLPPTAAAGEDSFSLPPTAARRINPSGVPEAETPAVIDKSSSDSSSVSTSPSILTLDKVKRDPESQLATITKREHRLQVIRNQYKGIPEERVQSWYEKLWSRYDDHDEPYIAPDPEQVKRERGIRELMKWHRLTRETAEKFYDEEEKREREIQDLMNRHSIKRTRAERLYDEQRNGESEW